MSTARWAKCWSSSRATGLEENTLVIITADHGEHFGEHHLLSHHYSLYEPLVRVPLIVRYADRFKAGEEERLVQSHDVYPTILELAGVAWKRVPGQTCQSLLEPPSEARTGISEYLMFDMGPLDGVCLNLPADRPVAFHPAAPRDSAREHEVDPPDAGQARVVRPRR